MTFKKTSSVKCGSCDEWELNNFASKLDTSIHIFITHISHHEITLISYSDNRWSDDSVYKQLGFKFDRGIGHDYRCILV